MNLHNKVERAIIKALISFLDGYGFKPTFVFDGEENVKCSTVDAAIEAITAVDESWLHFKANKGVLGSGARKDHGVYLILGNGEDVISDWRYSEGDADGFNKAMDTFTAMIDECGYAMTPPPASSVARKVTS